MPRRWVRREEAPLKLAFQVRPFGDAMVSNVSLVVRCEHFPGGELTWQACEGALDRTIEKELELELESSTEGRKRVVFELSCQSGGRMERYVGSLSQEEWLVVEEEAEGRRSEEARPGFIQWRPARNRVPNPEAGPSGRSVGTQESPRRTPLVGGSGPVTDLTPLPLADAPDTVEVPSPRPRSDDPVVGPVIPTGGPIPKQGRRGGVRRPSPGAPPQSRPTLPRRVSNDRRSQEGRSRRAGFPLRWVAGIAFTLLISIAAYERLRSPENAVESQNVPPLRQFKAGDAGDSTPPVAEPVGGSGSSPASDPRPEMPRQALAPDSDPVSAAGPVAAPAPRVGEEVDRGVTRPALSGLASSTPLSGVSGDAGDAPIVDFLAPTIVRESSIPAVTPDRKPVEEKPAASGSSVGGEAENQVKEVIENYIRRGNSSNLFARPQSDLFAEDIVSYFGDPKVKTKSQLNRKERDYFEKWPKRQCSIRGGLIDVRPDPRGGWRAEYVVDYKTENPRENKNNEGSTRNFARIIRDSDGSLVIVEMGTR